MASVRSNASLRAASLLYLASLAQAMPALGDFKYQGCYTDSNDNQALTGKVVRDDKMTLQKCATACKDYQWFGVEYGTQCFCGTSLSSNAEKRPDTECKMKCGGNRCQVCGDSDRLNVFWTGRDATGSNLETAADFEYKSCWTDNHGEKSLTGAKFSQDDMTIETCAELCKDYGYFGLEFGSDCFCGNDLGGQTAPKEQCGYLCAGDASQRCGGWEHLNVYAVKSATSELPPTSTFTSSIESTAAAETTSQTTSETTSEFSTRSESTTSSEAPTTSEAITTTEILTTSSLSTTEPPTTTSSPEPISQTPTPTPTTTSPACELTTTPLPTPNPCWAAMPTVCNQMSSLSRQPIFATRCSQAFSAGTSVLPQIATCFSDLSSPRFSAAAAHACVASAAGVFCEVKTVCQEDAALPTGPGAPAPTNVLGDLQGGFEDGALWPAWGSGNAAAADLRVEVSTARAHEGRYALAAVFSNARSATARFSKRVALDPGGVYEVTWWWWGQNSAAATWTEVYIAGGGESLKMEGKTYQKAPQQWQQESATFTAGTSFADVRLTIYGNDQSAPNTFFVDDIKMVRVA